LASGESCRGRKDVLDIIFVAATVVFVVVAVLYVRGCERLR
jgi:hypothetical protein